MRAIYIANLEAYNRGNLIGLWIKTEGKDLDELKEEVPSEWEEYAIFDSEGLGKVEEYTSLEQIADLEEAIEEVGNAEAFLAFRSLVGSDYANPDNFMDMFCGEYESDTEFAYSVLVEGGIWDSLSELGQNYFDVDKYTRDLMFDHQEIDGFYFTR